MTQTLPACSGGQAGGDPLGPRVIDCLEYFDDDPAPCGVLSCNLSQAYHNIFIRNKAQGFEPRPVGLNAHFEQQGIPGDGLAGLSQRRRSCTSDLAGRVRPIRMKVLDRNI